MSRIAKKLIVVPVNVHITLIGQKIIVKKENNALCCTVNSCVLVTYENNCLSFKSKSCSSKGWAQAGTLRSLVNSMIIGLTVGFSKKLQLLGVGFKISTIDSKFVHMSLGYSHLIKYLIPKGIIVECLSSVEVIIKGADKQLVGQVAANIRSYKIPESYKGKGIRYSDEIVRIKEAKKK
ncbi:50S ribosomal protein L6 [Buchnera aphidicola (Schlechtendalia chinensis)]|uniref:50S ribosomal protein L6 n=1 Tax=Buchnera aphidicola subsp. Schlechtendalia chinensis TaxID=118110 RepID=A0A172WDZ6_BUCSC|nr:50S ribosomal protein L6 [Buchnera aphidicola]ANF17210.1 50S ribosomal protein L6 [Buchnera aphidicola (Schlechtendalia chinensis)]